MNLITQNILSLSSVNGLAGAAIVILSTSCKSVSESCLPCFAVMAPGGGDGEPSLSLEPLQHHGTVASWPAGLLPHRGAGPPTGARAASLHSMLSDLLRASGLLTSSTTVLDAASAALESACEAEAAAYAADLEQRRRRPAEALAGLAAAAHAATAVASAQRARCEALLQGGRDEPGDAEWAALEGAVGSSCGAVRSSYEPAAFAQLVTEATMLAPPAWAAASKAAAEAVARAIAERDEARAAAASAEAQRAALQAELQQARAAAEAANPSSRVIADTLAAVKAQYEAALAEAALGAAAARGRAAAVSLRDPLRGVQRGGTRGAEGGGSLERMVAALTARHASEQAALAAAQAEELGQEAAAQEAAAAWIAQRRDAPEGEEAQARRAALQGVSTLARVDALHEEVEALRAERDALRAAVAEGGGPAAAGDAEPDGLSRGAPAWVLRRALVAAKKEAAQARSEAAAEAEARRAAGMDQLAEAVAGEMQLREAARSAERARLLAAISALRAAQPPSSSGSLIDGGSEDSWAPGPRLPSTSAATADAAGALMGLRFEPPEEAAAEARDGASLSLSSDSEAESEAGAEQQGVAPGAFAERHAEELLPARMDGVELKRGHLRRVHA